MAIQKFKSYKQLSLLYDLDPSVIEVKFYTDEYSEKIEVVYIFLLMSLKIWGILADIWWSG